MRKLIITCLIASNVVLMAMLLLAKRPTANDLLDSYQDIAIGDPESKLIDLLDSPDFFLVGVAEQTPDGPTWTLEWTQDGPITTLLTPNELKKNAFLNLGWTYPVHPLTDRVMVIAERGGIKSGFIYFYMDATRNIVAIYVGGS
jgi:hypothetical protein